MRALVGATFVASVVGLNTTSSAAGASGCTSTPVACENALPGSPASEWQITGDGETSIQGFATQQSVSPGETVSFKVKTDAANYRIDIYRLGYYGGDGARRVATVLPVVTLPQTQPSCASDASVRLVDCGNWAVSARWSVPVDAVSGVYVAHLLRSDTTGRGNHIVFVVRDDVGHSDLLFQTSDATWQAYNAYGGSNLYTENSVGGLPAQKVSYNRPVTMREYQPYSSFFSAEYPMLRWLERNGYDVSYFSGVDTATRAGELQEHKVFLSVGHDEYWSSEQRASVEAARDAGVNLAFFSGNEMFWKTRWETSIDGSGTPFRTMVTYKETRQNARVDPTGIWTGTWRDPRFSPPADGGRPENAVTGQLYRVDAFRTDPLTVPAADGRMRFWRNTGIDQLPAGGVATLPAGILGYEWDVDEDNGFRPPGLIRMSSTTISGVKYLVDYGSTYDTRSATHALTLYRASSGALVFGAGTVQWSWGLDDVHDLDGTPTDPRIQQATLNLFADMGAQPRTLQSGLTPASASTDTTGPTTTITSPLAGATVPRGALTVSGTAVDSGGGMVSAVEVSTDAGATWHPASGRSSWTYSFGMPSSGSVTIKARAADDSANLGAAATATVQTDTSCPCTVWSDAVVPSTPSFSDPKSYELGMRFQADKSGYITGVRFYKGAGNTGSHLGHLWTNAGTLLSTATFRSETASGWQQASFPSPVPVTANTTYVVSYYAPNGNYALTRPFFTAPVTNQPLKALADGVDGANGVFISGPVAFPNKTVQSSNYWVDVVFDTVPTDRVAPSVLSTKPAAGATGTGLTQPVQAAFDEALAPASVTTATVELRGPSGPVATTVAFDSAANRINITPSAALASASTYVATVRGGAGGVTDTAGNPLAADYTWSFTTFSPALCPCSIWPSSTVPSITANADTNGYELGVKFRSDMDGYITGIRFYKGSGNTGTHFGHLWSSTGTMLGEIKFLSETATGWQEATFGTPVAIRANTTYIASYWDPAGRYALDRPFFTSGVDTGILHALADGVDGGNGVLKSGSTGFPNKSNQSSNYWVDVVFSTDGTDRRPPNVVSTTPASGATGVGLYAAIRATVDEPLATASLTSANVQLRSSSGTVAAAVGFDAASSQITLTPSAPLVEGTQYTATIRGGPGGVTDVAGNPLLADTTWSFTTFAAASCPCSIWSIVTTPGTPSNSSDTSPYELGVKFRSDMPGYVTGVRFYKGSGNTGTHLGHLWTASGTMLAEATFTNETATGWQQVTFSTPVAIAANTTYIASYFDPVGRYALDRPFFTVGVDNGALHALADGVDGGNGVLKPGSTGFPFKSTQSSNYWVDVVFTSDGTDRQPPTIRSSTPAGGTTGAALNQVAVAQFDEALAPASVNGSTVELRTTAGQVPATVSFDASTKQLSVTPVGPLMPGTTYTVLIHGGSSGVTDTAGNPLAADYSWSYTTYTCPCTIWPSTRVPSDAEYSDTNAYELGFKFRSDIDGYISAIRFYKGASNTGTHVGHLWSGTGTMLGEVTFTNESASGWQQATFATAIPIQANTTYIASYYAPVGRYALDRPFFTNAVNSRHLHALADGTDGPNGVFAGPGASAFPTKSVQQANYWVDVVFTTAP